MIYRVITPKTREWVMEDARRLGFRSDDLLDLDPYLGPSPHDFSGVEIVCDCRHEEYPKGSGEWKERWSIHRAPFRQRRLTAEELQELQTKLGERFRQAMARRIKPELRQGS
jgi:hypothetical protein